MGPADADSDSVLSLLFVELSVLDFVLSFDEALVLKGAEGSETEEV